MAFTADAVVVISSYVVCHISVVFHKIVMLSSQFAIGMFFLGVRVFCYSLGLGFCGFFVVCFVWFGVFLTVVCDNTIQGHKQILKDHLKLEQ